MTAPERIWASSVTENYGEWQTVTDGMPRPTEYVRADLVPSRCTSCDGTGDIHRIDGEWLGECNCGSEFRHAFDVEANPSKAYRVIQLQAARIAALEAQLADRARVKPLEWARGWMNAEAQTEIGRYEITYRRDGSFEWSIGCLKEWASSWDAAKSAAQADYERRIFSAIEE